MATPSSSTTTPSPQLRYLQTSAAAPPVAANINTTVTANDKEERDRAVEKFLARAEIAKLTRGLRTRLSYASYKATHNVAHNTLPDLEAQSQSQGANTRNAQGRTAGNYYNNPATQGNSAMSPGTSARAAPRKGSMAPPPPVTASATQSLFASILAPPPAKRPRTIHNPQDPPVPAPTRMTGAPSPLHKSSKTRVAEGSQAKSKARKPARGKGKGKEHANAPARAAAANSAEVDVDMQVAATLTSLMLSRQSIPTNASSPRSSLSAGSDAGSTQSFSQYAQSSARTVTAAASTSAQGRQSTPAPGGRQRRELSRDRGRGEGQLTPKPLHRVVSRVGASDTPHQPSDTEAADLMLFLATSPSPVRPAVTRDARDVAFRGLGGSSLKGRALFSSLSGNPSLDAQRPLRREDTGSFASSITAVNDYPDAIPGEGANRKLSRSPPPKLGVSQGTDSSFLDVPMEPTITPPTPTDHTAVQLLPAPQSPFQEDRSRTTRSPTFTDRPSSAALRPGFPPPDGKKVASPPPFYISDFVNVSPSPAAGAGPQSRHGTSLSVDIGGRRLFDDSRGLNGSGRRTDSATGRRSGLGTGIDLVKS
ncbi:hypothetical protein BKA93DRAFT_828351 [Sparassis latifolia]